MRCHAPESPAALAWVPLLLLAVIQGVALGATPRESFLLDVAAHVRYLVAIPLLIAAEPWCLPQLAEVARHFASAGLVVGEDRVRLEALMGSARSGLDHRGAEVVLAAAAYAGTAWLIVSAYPLDAPTWTGTSRGLTLAGWWRALVSHPLFLVLSAGWLWRVGVWARFLWGVSRLRLRLVPAHPDLAAGLHFLAVSLRAFGPVALAVGAVVAGTVAEQIVHAAPPPQTSRQVAAAIAAVVVALVLFAGPLLAFFGPLRRARMRGIFDYGALAGALGRRFEERWLRTGRLDPEALKSPDFSATTDLYSIVGNVRQTGLLPVGVRDVVPLVVVTLVPFIPLLFLLVPVDEMLSHVASFFF